MPLTANTTTRGNAAKSPSALYVAPSAEAAVASTEPAVLTTDSRSPSRAPIAIITVSWSLAVFVLFTLDEVGAFPGVTSEALFLPLLCLVALTGVSTSFWLTASERSQFCTAGIIALGVTVPINRIPGASNVELAAFITVVAVLTAVAVFSSRFTASKSTLALLGLLVLAMTFPTVVAGSSSGYIKLALALVPATSVFLMACRLDVGARRTVAMAVVSVAIGESLLAIPEPFFYVHAIWPGVGVEGVVVPNSNLLPGLTRAQGTMGHPLALGFLLIVALGLALRVVRPRVPVRLASIVVLLTAVVMTGSRNSVILAALLLLLFPVGQLKVGRLIWGTLGSAILLCSGVVFAGLTFDFVQEFTQSGSYSHRVAAGDGFWQLLSAQDVFRTIFGNGFDGLRSLFAAGLLQTDGLNVVDNEFVTQFGQAGLFGLVCLVSVIVRPLFFRDASWRAAALVIFSSCFVFDWVAWPNCATVGFFVLGSAFAEHDRVGNSVSAQMASKTGSQSLSPFPRQLNKTAPAVSAADDDAVRPMESGDRCAVAPTPSGRGHLLPELVGARAALPPVEELSDIHSVLICTDRGQSPRGLVLVGAVTLTVTVVVGLVMLTNRASVQNAVAPDDLVELQSEAASIVAAAAPVPKLRIAAYGDSITSADSPNLNSGEVGAGSWAGYLPAEEMRFIGGFAKSGVTAAELANEVSAPQNADVLVIMVGVQDVLKATDFMSTATAIRQMVQVAGATQVLISSITPNDSDVQGVTSLNADLMSFATETGYQFVDAAAAVRSSADGKFKPNMSTDGVHPSAAGARAIAEMIGDAIASDFAPAQ